MFEKLKSPKARLTTTLALALLALGPCAAGAEAAEGAAPATGMTKGADAQPVDESALRYYASTGQAVRAEAEERRLHALYPNWTPPKDLDKQAAAGGEDEDDLWDLFAADRLDALRAAIEARRAAEPGWEPSPDLRAKFRAKMFRDQVVGMAKDKRYGDIVRWLKSSSARLDGVDIDVLWTIAEAYQKAHLNDQALAIYKGILTSNSDPAQRLATVQKSLGSLRMDEVEQLLAMARKDAAGRSEFAPIATDVARARIAAFLHDERRQEVDDTDIKQFGAYARAASDPDQPALLGWYYYKLKRYSPALDWFKYALEHGGDAMVAHGMALTLRFLGMNREAEEVAYAWRQPLVNNSILFIDVLERDLTKPIPPFIEPARLARYGEVAMATASGEGAQALAWYAYNSCQISVAREWFERAVAWHPKESTVYGYVLTLRRLKKRKEANELINRYDGLFPKAVEILFPDGRINPPTPCDENARQQRYIQATAGWSANYPPYGYVQDRTGRHAWGRVAGPGQNGFGYAAPLPKVSRAEFPIRVAPQNPLRFAPAGQAPLVNAQVGADQPAREGGFAREPASWIIPLVARRVPGVGPMPYERYGFALLPAYNGVITASSPTAAEEAAPAGTLWSLEHNDPSPETNAAPPMQPQGPGGPTPAIEIPAASGPAKTDPTRNG